MILYRKAPQLRVRRSDAPEAPFWSASVLEPYSPRRGEPLALDLPALRATAAERLEVTVCEDVAAALERSRPPRAPVLIDASGRAEQVFRRGAEALAWCEGRQLDATLLVSGDGALPDGVPAGSILVAAAWPPDAGRFDDFSAAARSRGAVWGVLVPVVFAMTTDLPFLESVADAAARAGAKFLAAATIELDATAKQAVSRVLGLNAEDDRYAMLFHSRLEPVGVATERHVAALAAERGLGDSIPVPGREERSNWSAAAHLALAATRMLAMELDVDLAGLISRSARGIAALDKPITRIAESASLTIVESLDETSATMLAEWLETGRSSFSEWVAEEWRLRRN